MMTLRSKVELAFALLAVVLLGFGVWTYWQSKVDLINAQAAAKVAQAQRDAAQLVIDQKEKDIQGRDADAARQQQTIATLQAQVRTAQDAISHWSQVTTTPAPRPVTPTDLLPDAPSAVKPGDYVIPNEQVAPLFNQLAEGKKCAIGLQTCQADLQDRVAQMAQAQKQLDALAKERDSWKKAAKGGSFKRRFFRTVEVIGCAGGGAWVGSRLKGASGAAIGAGSAAAACQMFIP